MATQTYVTDMQGINPSAVQVQNQGATSGAVTKTESSSPSQTATIIQPTGSGQQQFIVTIGDPNGEAVQLPQSNLVQEIQVQQGGQVIYQPHQYVEGASSTPDHNSIYAASNGQMQYTEYSPTMYTPVTGAYYQTSNAAQGLQGQILTHQGGTYLVQSSAAMDNEGHPLTHTTRASPATDPNGQRAAHFDVKSWQREVQWLIDNYETAEGVSLPRSTLYSHYLRHCQEQKIDPMNPASFGKLIRSVFLGLRTRRLGTRGNSKYHYYGIRIKATSPLNQYTDDSTMAMRQTPVNPTKRYKAAIGAGGADGDGTGVASGSDSTHNANQQFLGDASQAIPNFGHIDCEDDTALPDGITQDHLMMFEDLYKQHSEAILDIVVNLQFSLIENLWQRFWRSDNQSESLANVVYQGETDENLLPKEVLYEMCEMKIVQDYVRKSDYAFYQALVEVLIPDVLRPIPSSLTQAIRNFAKSLETWLKNSMENCREEMVKTKLGAVSAFAQTLRRYTSLNHLAQAARAVLQNTTQISQMLTDLNRVDFANVQEQASWVCQCDDEVVHQLEQDFKKTLQGQNSLEQWAVWLEGVVTHVLKPHENTPAFPKAARQFLLKWSFYSSMVIRDLTLRSAASFGSFHLIRLLYDEYMFYLVEHKVAAATGETPIAVMGDFIDLSGMLSVGGGMQNDSVLKPVTTSINKQVTTTQQPALLNLSSAVKATSAATQQLQNNTVASGAAAQQVLNSSTLTVLTSSGGSGKTIVVVPMSAGDGGPPHAKKLKAI